MPRFQNNVAAIAFVGVFAAAAIMAWQRPDDLVLIASVCAGFYVVVLLVGAFEWRIYTSESPAAVTFFRVGPVVVLVLTAAVAVSLSRGGSDPPDLVPKEDPLERLPVTERDEITQALRDVIYPEASSEGEPVEAPKP